MIIRKAPTFALAGALALGFTGVAFAQVGGGTEMPSSAKKAEPSNVSGSPANKASNGGAGSMKGGAMKGDSSMMKGGSGCGMMKK